MGTRKLFWGDGYVHFLDFGDGFMGVYVYPKHQNVYPMYVQLYVNYTSLKLLKKKIYFLK